MTKTIRLKICKATDHGYCDGRVFIAYVRDGSFVRNFARFHTKGQRDRYVNDLAGVRS